MESPSAAIERGNAPPIAAARAWTADRLQAEYYDEVFAYLSRRIRPREEAEDLALATFVAAFQNLGRIRGIDPRCFLFGIARRKLADALRKRRHLSTLSESVPAASSPFSEVGDVLKQALSKLPPDQCEALMLQNLEDLSVREIADVMKRSEKAVKALLQRAREGLRSNSLLRSIAEEINV